MRKLITVLSVAAVLALFAFPVAAKADMIVTFVSGRDGHHHSSRDGYRRHHHSPHYRYRHHYREPVYFNRYHPPAPTWRIQSYRTPAVIVREPWYKQHARVVYR